MAWERMSNIGRYLRILCLKSTSQKNRRKNRIIRIFCELLAKMRLGSLINRGVPEGTVEMREARRRALTHCVETNGVIIEDGRNERSPKKGIDTYSVLLCQNLFQGRNERSPKKGIDTDCGKLPPSDYSSVEMREARRRALTHNVINPKANPKHA